MLRHAVLLAAMFCLAHSQRPWHAGTSNRLPAVLPQYLDEQAAAAQAAEIAQRIQTGQDVEIAIEGTIDATIQGTAQGTIQGTVQGTIRGTVQETQGAPIAGANATIANRIDGSGNVVTALPITTTTARILPEDLPVDAHGDIDLINRIKTWPRDKQPFWYINWQAIQAHRGDVNNTAQPADTQPNTRSFFAG